jgi:hypothetical protein
MKQSTREKIHVGVIFVRDVANVVIGFISVMMQV